jgi:hypothetical protein
MRIGLADCPIARLRAFTRKAKTWDKALQDARASKTPVSWLPFDVVRAFERELEFEVVPISGANSRALLYFVFPGKTERRDRLEQRDTARAAVNGELEALEFFFLERGTPKYQLNSVSGALTTPEEQFLASNLSRVVYRSSCLTTAHAALTADVKVPFAQLAQTLDLATRSSRSTLVLYGAFQSPLWYMLSGDHGPGAEAEALIALWNNLEAIGPTAEREYVTSFFGWLLLHVSGKEVAGTSNFRGSAGGALGVVSSSASANMQVSSNESLSVESYELLIEPKSLKLDSLKNMGEIQLAWDRSPLSHHEMTVALDSSGNGGGEVRMPRVSSILCSWLTSGDSYAIGTDDSGPSSVNPKVSLGGATFRDNVCEVPIRLENIDTALRSITLYVPVSKTLHYSRPPAAPIDAEGDSSPSLNMKVSIGLRR